MTFKESCSLLAPEKRITDIMKMDYLSKEDINVCDYVIKQIPNIRSKGFEVGKSINLDRLIEMSLNEISNLSEYACIDLDDLILDVPINRFYDDYLRFSCQIKYTTYGDNYIILKETGRVDSYLIPKKLYESSIYGFSHEHIHALKETNYNEYKNAFILGEVIPLFYELFVFDPNDVLKKELLIIRINQLFDNAIEFLMINKIVKGMVSSNGDNYLDRSVYEYARSKVGCYLNSFYYAVILYSMYKQTPMKILNLINKVLKHEMTTLDMLIELEIYCDIKGEIFEKELRNIKKLVKIRK